METKPVVFQRFDGSLVIKSLELVPTQPVYFEANKQNYFVVRKDNNVLEVYRIMKNWEVILMKIFRVVKLVMKKTVH